MAVLAPRIFNTLSGGEKARTHLARALAQVWKPLAGGAARWLLLDEPTAALDLAHQHQSLSLLRHWAHTQGGGVVAVLHDLNLAARADHVLLLHQGRVLAEGTPDQVLTPENLQAAYHVRVKVLRDADRPVIIPEN